MNDECIQTKITHIIHNHLVYSTVADITDAQYILSSGTICATTRLNAKILIGLFRQIRNEVLFRFASNVGFAPQMKMLVSISEKDDEIL